MASHTTLSSAVRPGNANEAAPSANSSDRGYFQAAAALIFHPELSPAEKLLVMAIGLSDRGDGNGGFPSNATLIKACGLKSTGPDKGMKALRRLLGGLRD